MRFGYFRRRSSRNSQSGYLLITLMIMVTLLVIAAVAVAPTIVTQIRHDREQELVHRGAQYARAVKKFYKKFGRYPVSIAQLENTNNIRFLRRKYKDPITGEDFRLLHFGEVQLTAKSSGADSAGGQSGQNSGTTGGGAEAAVAAAMAQSQSSGSLQFPSGSASSSSGFGQPASSFGQSSSGAGPTVGGGPIIGVASTSKKMSLMEFNNKNHYKDWAFIYDPTMDRGGLINGPFVPSKAGVGGVVPGSGSGAGLTTTTTPQSGFGASPASSFGQPSGGAQEGPK